MTAAWIVAIVLAAPALLLLLALARHGLFAKHRGTHRRTAKPGTREAQLIDMTTVHDIPVMAVTPATVDQLRDQAARILKEVTA